MEQKRRQAGKSWDFALGILTPAGLALAVTLITICSFVFWSTNKSDEEALALQRQLVNHLLKDAMETLPSQQEAFASWDEAAAAVEPPSDLEWIAFNLGADLDELYGVDVVFVLDPRLDAIYAMRDGSTVDVGFFDSLRTPITPLARRLREIDWQGALSAYVFGASDHLPYLTDIIDIEGRPATVSVMPIVSDTTDVAPAPGSEYLHVAIRYLDEEVAAEISDRLQLPGSRFQLAAEVSPGEVAVPLANAAGAPGAYFVWTPDLPGARILKSTGPALGGALMILMGIIAMLVWRLRRSTAELERGRAAAQHLAFHDALTGLGNRALFEERLTDAVTAARKGEDTVAVLLLDLDRFKLVNDTLGHEAGDELIRHVAARLRPLLRGSDTIARLGGDEFAIIRTGVTAIHEITHIADFIVAAIKKPFDVANSQAYVGVSIGIALAPDCATDAQELVRKADIALYDAKGSGRNRYKVFEDRMHEAVQQRLEIETDLRQAFARNAEIGVEFDPIIDTTTGEIIGSEAIAWWEHPLAGFLAGDQLHQIAESAGLAEQLGNRALQAACAAGVRPFSKRIAIRVYGAQLNNPNFFDRAFTLVSENGMMPANLEMIVSDNIVDELEEAALANIRKLHQAGISFALCDFGTGGSALEKILELPVGRIRIDHSFVERLEAGPRDKAIARAIVSLCTALEVAISANRVETQAQAEFLAGIGCTLQQGPFHGSRDLSAWAAAAERYERNTALELKKLG